MFALCHYLGCIHLSCLVRLNQTQVRFPSWCGSFGQVWIQQSHSGADLWLKTILYLFLLSELANYMNKAKQNYKISWWNEYLHLMRSTLYFVKSLVPFCTNYMSIEINQDQTVKNYIWLLSAWLSIYTTSSFISWSECSHTYFQYTVILTVKNCENATVKTC